MFSNILDFGFGVNSLLFCYIFMTRFQGFHSFFLICSLIFSKTFIVFSSLVYLIPLIIAVIIYKPLLENTCSNRKTSIFLCQQHYSNVFSGNSVFSLLLLKIDWLRSFLKPTYTFVRFKYRKIFHLHFYLI